jgi:hypothetical protein
MRLRHRLRPGLCVCQPSKSSRLPAGGGLEALQQITRLSSGTALKRLTDRSADLPQNTNMLEACRPCCEVVHAQAVLRDLSKETSE